MGIFDRIFKKQEKHLNTDEHFRAFSSNPDLNYCQLSNLKDNSKAIEFIENNSIYLKHVESGKSNQLNELIEETIVFLVTWDAYCARTIGSLKRKIENKEISKLSIILFEENEGDIRLNKSESWYFKYIYVLNNESKEYAEMIGRVPMLIKIDKTGKIERTETGLIE
ncbi:hypothetical protein H0I23_06305 [Cellulophaga sp. HaHaR_3_176]|uniref:hypothetical protein n=1 Tax=Cellulophaga sp. HaHaR_3_176 TaxID=1942464 RepID=UPI001C1F34D4|nr:hypothetical protein [Cellulophaga sp. HaHaR_3_176]QWX85247.1 hypothetical protein H0I23_06305 [Cellulophaga sp. HaHaR_3_176]